jgi:hypothetical protein
VDASCPLQWESLYLEFLPGNCAGRLDFQQARQHPYYYPYVQLLPLFRFLDRTKITPAGAWAAALGAHFTPLSKVAQNLANPVPAYSGARPLDVGDAEFAFLPA